MNVALIGAGWVVQNIWLPLLEEAGMHIACVIEPIPDIRHTLKQRLPDLRLEEQLSAQALCGCDMAFICTPNAYHVEHAAFALRHGLHVILEKPACFSLDEAHFLIALSQEQKRGLWVTSASSMRSDVRLMTERVRQGVLGNLHCIDVSWRRKAGIPRLGSWFTEEQSALVGSGGDLGWHLLEVALGLLDYPIVESGFSRQVLTEDPQRFLASWRGDAISDTKAKLNVDTQLFGCLLTETGVVIRLSTAWASHQEYDETNIHAYGLDGEMTLRCTFGFSTNVTPVHSLTLLRCGLTENLNFVAQDKIAPYRAFVEEILRRVDCFEGTIDVELQENSRKLCSLGSAIQLLYGSSTGISGFTKQTSPIVNLEQKALSQKVNA